VRAKDSAITTRLFEHFGSSLGSRRAQAFDNPFGVTSAVQNRIDVNRLVFYRVLHSEGKSFGQHSMKAVSHLVDAGEDFQGSYICLHAVKKIVAQPYGILFIEVPAVSQILFRRFK
jgi:hypothetical protein